MPMIKFPKGFTRRKSSGNALEELANLPEPSFRVFERSGSKSFDGGNTLKRMSQGRPLSADVPADDNIFVDRRTSVNPNNRGSGGTNKSTSSGGNNDNSSSSARFSSSSTLPSSTDVPLDEKPLPNPMEPQKISIPPIPDPNPLSLRAAGRTFSFGRKKAQTPSIPAPVPRYTSPSQSLSGYSKVTRERAMTESSYASGSTATPPKLLDTDLNLGQSDLDGFGSMFESFGKRRSQLMQEQEGKVLGITESPADLSPTVPTLPSKTHFGDRSTFTPPPLQLDAFGQVDSSPYSWGSQDSQDGLIDSATPTRARPVSIDDAPAVPQHAQGSIPLKSKPLPDPRNPQTRPRLQRPQSTIGTGLRRSSAYAPQRDSYLWQDEDAKLVMDSISASRRLNRQPAAFRSHNLDANSSTSVTLSAYPQPPIANSENDLLSRGQNLSANMFDSNDQDVQSSNRRLESSETTPRVTQRGLVQPAERSLFDAPPPTSGRLDAPPHQTGPNPHKTHGQAKIMTPAQFERYRREQEMTRTKSNGSKSEESDDENESYDDDDETERNRQLARQRRRQEAHLAVYRQQMMKVTGEQPSDLPNLGLSRPGMDRASMSTPDLSGRTATPTFSFDKAPETSKASDDEDEDIPLGILAAHGFPSKNRPPSGIGNYSATPHIQYSSESYPPPPMSTAGVSIAGGRKGLPPFARNLPSDPYYGAGLVNPSNRESLAFSSNAGGSNHGGLSLNLPPGGLVGVIAGEERARAMRRGSPNAQGNYGSPLPQGMPQMPPGMSPNMSMPMMPSGSEAQAQMSHQMTQMMQMQMQWMQQMQQMVVGGMQGPASGLPQQFLPPQQQQIMNSGFLSPPGQMSRPMSMSSHSAPESPAPGQQRAMSMMGPSPGTQWPSHGNVRLTAPSIMTSAMGNQGYVPSIAPSERSNIGMPTRYRPVSIAPIDEAPRLTSRASTFMSGVRQSAEDKQRSYLPTIRPVQPSQRKGPTASDDDDDEEGWEQMKRRREEKKKSMWKLKKDDHDIQELSYSQN